MFDPLSLFFVLFAIVLLGIAKGGFGGVGTTVALPVMSLGLSTEIALGVILPLLLFTDVVSLTAHRKNTDYQTVLWGLPGAVLGVAIGASIIAIVPASIVSATVGVLAITFAITAFSGVSLQTSHWPNWISSVFGAISGVTSTLAHAGGPPMFIFLLAKGYTPAVFVATAAMFMAGVNVLKIVPYFMIGALNKDILMLSLYLAPIAVLAAIAGVYISRVLSKSAFTYIVNSLMIVAGTKLVLDAFL